ncbi:Hypothetical protein NTJ_08173 [Nesidiocoris tenuis]|uniref:Uncharacterized protein n=1 Tax=Nesidiocoris tenuis TaxID=355587 RepID=A0ABN7ATU1_9HEMI|nr:Hypothetical protein NTJ_08173 [Nesidiocoris tenuis]
MQKPRGAFPGNSRERETSLPSLSSAASEITTDRTERQKFQRGKVLRNICQLGCGEDSDWYLLRLVVR